MPYSNAANHAKYQYVVDNFPVIEFLDARSERAESGCLEWGLATNTTGYGVYTFAHTVTVSIHRLSYWVHHGPIEGELVVDHICQNRKCLEPSHLRLLTRAENTSLAHTARKANCIHGHAMTPENTYVFYDRKRNPHRQCKTCRIDINERSKQKRFPNRVPTGPRLPHTIAAARARQAALSVQ